MATIERHRYAASERIWAAKTERDAVREVVTWLDRITRQVLKPRRYNPDEVMIAAIMSLDVYMAVTQETFEYHNRSVWEAAKQYCDWVYLFGGDVHLKSDRNLAEGWVILTAIFKPIPEGALWYEWVEDWAHWRKDMKPSSREFRTLPPGTKHHRPDIVHEIRGC